MHQAKLRQEREVATRNTKSPRNRCYDQGRVAKIEGIFKEESEVSTLNEDDVSRNVNLRSRR